MRRSNNNQVVLITGSSSGIGYSLALAFAKAGFQTIATMRNTDKAPALLEAASKQNVSLDIRQLDVCNDRSVEVCVNEVLEHYGRIDILINNAGEGFRSTLEQTSLDDIKKVMDVNFYGVVRLTKAVLPFMRQAKSGHIITISSLGGLIAVPFSDVYCGAKFAVEGIMEALAPVVNAFGVHVSLIEPGPVATSFAGKLQQKTGEVIPVYDELEKSLRANFPKHFPSGPQTGDDIAKIVLTAALSETPQFRYVTSAEALKVASNKYVNINDNSCLRLGQELFSDAEEALA